MLGNRDALRCSEVDMSAGFLCFFRRYSCRFFVFSVWEVCLEKKSVEPRNLDVPPVIKIKFLHQCLWFGVMVIVLTVSPTLFLYFLSNLSYDFP